MPHALGDIPSGKRSLCAIPSCARFEAPGMGGYCSPGHRHAARLIEDPDFDTDLGITHLDAAGSAVLQEMLDDENIDPTGKSYLDWLHRLVEVDHGATEPTFSEPNEV